MDALVALYGQHSHMHRSFLALMRMLARGVAADSYFTAALALGLCSISASGAFLQSITYSGELQAPSWTHTSASMSGRMRCLGFCFSQLGEHHEL